MTRAEGLTRLLRERMVFSERVSVTYPMTALIPTTVMITAASARPPVRSEIPAAAARSSTGTPLNCSTRIDQDDRDAASGRIFGPKRLRFSL